MTLVKDRLLQDYILFESTTTIATAINQLQQQKKRFGVVFDVTTEWPILVTKESLIQMADHQLSIGSIAQNLPRMAPIGEDESIEQIVRILANEIVKDATLLGLVALNEKNQISGILPRKMLAQIAAGMNTRGGDSRRLEGASSVTGIYFYCPQDNEEQLVSYYNPASPPKCAKGHMMKRKPRSS